MFAAFDLSRPVVLQSPFRCHYEIREKDTVVRGSHTIIRTDRFDKVLQFFKELVEARFAGKELAELWIHSTPLYKKDVFGQELIFEKIELNTVFMQIYVSCDAFEEEHAIRLYTKDLKT
jgi:hypothetical protein